ncbi:uncharacterized protein LOC108665863 [Hyalella azteca]|uniref:Uncharacterized protein LOC108665863 n=1 Tax=Hyalella azteca TaxID=294128 RepID=A0A8B7N2V0_HYAAZ|nr:uncharacterized protein LOC108665863 [Hyalella azteca]
MRTNIAVCVVTLACVLLALTRADSNGGLSCSSCGSECQEACGTRHFRACCFNFQRRRRSGSGADEGETAADSDPSGSIITDALQSDSLPDGGGAVAAAQEEAWNNVNRLLKALNARAFKSTVYPGGTHGPFYFRPQISKNYRWY